MKIRGIRMSQWVKQEQVKKLVQRVFPGTSVHVYRNHGSRKLQICWSGAVSYDDMRALADEIEAAVPPKAALTIKCQRDAEQQDLSTMSIAGVTHK
jgi:hypothetical protein